MAFYSVVQKVDNPKAITLRFEIRWKWAGVSLQGGPGLTPADAGVKGQGVPGLTLADARVKRPGRDNVFPVFSRGHPLPSCPGLLAGVSPGTPCPLTPVSARVNPGPPCWLTPVTAGVTSRGHKPGTK